MEAPFIWPGRPRMTTWQVLGVWINTTRVTFGGLSCQSCRLSKAGRATGAKTPTEGRSNHAGQGRYLGPVAARRE